MWWRIGRLATVTLLLGCWQGRTNASTEMTFILCTEIGKKVCKSCKAGPKQGQAEQVSKSRNKLGHVGNQGYILQRNRITFITKCQISNIPMIGESSHQSASKVQVYNRISFWFWFGWFFRLKHIKFFYVFFSLFLLRELFSEIALFLPILFHQNFDRLYFGQI